MNNIQFLPFRFRQLSKDCFVLTNFVGDYTLVDGNDFLEIISSKIPLNSELFYELQSKLIISCGEPELDIKLLATRYRTKKAFLNDFTTLHMVVTTLRCNQACKYCHASAKNDSALNVDMSIDTAKKVAHLIMQSPSPSIKIEFQGGEPTLNMPAICAIIGTAKDLNNRCSPKNIEFVICTNLLNLPDSTLNYIIENDISISTSLDGPSFLHNSHRTTINNQETWQSVVENIKKIRARNTYAKLGALMTTTKDSLGKFPQIIDNYIDNGFNSIVFRSLNPYGRGFENLSSLNYPIEEFVESYKEGLLYILDLNKKGQMFSEGYTSLLLRRMLTPFSTGYVDLQSPAGAGISGVIYNYNGHIYACDEGRMLAEMGDNQFRLGSVDDPFLDIFNGENIRNIIESSIVETTPQCTDCAYRIWCGADPARHYATQRDLVGHKALSDFCKKHQMLFDFLITLLNSSDPTTRNTLFTWIGGTLDPKLGEQI